MNVFIDLETIPAQPEEQVKAEIAKAIEAPATMSKSETIAEWHAGIGKYAGVKDAAIEDIYRKTALDGSKGEIISIAFAVEDSEVVVHKRDGSEKELLVSALANLVAAIGGKSPWFIGHNIGGFDLKFLFQRCVINQVNAKIDFKHYGRHGSNFYDTMQAWAGFGNRISQDNLCKALGIEGKPGDITGSNVWDHYKAGNIDRIAEYNADDVAKVRKIWNRMHFIN